MNSISNITKQESEIIRIIVCDLGELDWIEFANGIVLVDYRYIAELERKHAG